MGQFSDLTHFFRPRQPAAPPTARENAERWIRALRGSDPVEAAEADAEVEFRREEGMGNWRESIGTVGFVPEPVSWPAGAEYTRRKFVGFGQAAFGHIQKPHEFESFLHESLAILSETTYRQKLRPYEQVADAEAEARVIARFHEYARTAASDDLNKLAYAAWERHKGRCRQKLAGNGDIIDESARKVDPPAGEAAIPEVVSPATADEMTPGLPAKSANAPPSGSGTAEAREARLQGFVSEHNTTIAAVCRAARVAKADLQRWRKGEMKSTSVMARRIEDVLSGKTPLLPEKEG